MIDFIRDYSDSRYPFWHPYSGAIGGIKFGALLGAFVIAAAILTSCQSQPPCSDCYIGLGEVLK